MDAAEHEILLAIERGERVFDWDAWFGDVDTARFLTPRGRAVAHRAAADLDELFGCSWLPKATDPASRHFVAELGLRLHCLRSAKRGRPRRTSKRSGGGAVCSCSSGVLLPACSRC